MRESTSIMARQGVGTFIGRYAAIGIVTLVFVVFLAPSVYAQIGNLDWASGEKAVKTKKKVNYEDVKFQFFMEPGVGAHRIIHTTTIQYDSDKEDEERKVDNNELMLDLAVGTVYRAFQTGGTGPKIDISLYAGAGANLIDFEFDYIRLVGILAPEVGLTPSSNGTYFRPFISFGPGFSFFNNHDDKTVDIVGVLRGGLEVGSTKGPFAGTLSVKRVGRGEVDKVTHDYSSYQTTRTSTESDLLLSLGIRYKLAL